MHKKRDYVKTMLESIDTIYKLQNQNLYQVLTRQKLFQNHQFL